MCIIKQSDEVADFSKWFSFFTAFILVITVVLYAGFRYHTETAFKTQFYSPGPDDELRLPAVTLCPMTTMGIPGINNDAFEIISWPNTTSSPPEPNPVPRDLAYRNTRVSCLTYNGNEDNYAIARNASQGMIIRFTQDSLAVSSPFEVVGAIGVLHDQSETPNINASAPLFYVPLGQTTQVAIFNYYTFRLDKSISQYYTAVPETVSRLPGASTQDIGQVILAYNEYGWFVQREYHVYRSYTWYGEVGGFACLLFFLQHAILWAAIAVARRTCYKKEVEASRAKKKAEKEAAEAEAEVQPEPVPANSTEMSSPKKRKKRNPDRIAIDMDESIDNV